MKYPFKIGCEIPENEERPINEVTNSPLLLERDVYNFNEEHEFLIVSMYSSVGGCWGADFPRKYVFLDILGYSDISDGTLNACAGKINWSVPLDEEIRDYDSFFEEYTVYHVKGYKSFRKPENIFITEFISAGEQNDFLMNLVEKAKNPVILHSDVLGDMVFDSYFNEFTGNKVFRKTEVEISFKTENESKDSPEILAPLEKFWKQRKKWDEKFRKFAAENLAEHAEEWADYEEEISTEDFAERIKMTSFSMNENKDFSAYYDDDDLFSGHSIVVKGNLDTGMQEAYMA